MARSSDTPAKSANKAIDASIVRELATILTDTGLTEIEVERGDLRVRVAKEAPTVAQVQAAIPAAPAPPAPAPETPAPVSPADAKAHPGAIPSPMVGTAYLAAEPGAAPFIEVGKSVSKGDTLLLIEAMKTFNPIIAPRDGKIMEILVTDGQPVEFDEVLLVLS